MNFYKGNVELKVNKYQGVCWFMSVHYITMFYYSH